MNIAFKDLCVEYGVPTAPHDHKHSRDGWVQIECPFCTGNEGYHLGWSIYDEYFHCWRCGWHSVDAVGTILTGLRGLALTKLLSDYKTASRSSLDGSRPHVKVLANRLKLPLCGELTNKHRNYLLKRCFNPDLLFKLWKIKGSGHIGNYRDRIIAPIFFHGKMVSYQGRDITDKSTLRYKACKKEKEVIHHKHILYGWDQLNDSAVIVEGFTDVWRFGFGACCPFGIKYTPSQLRLLGEKKRRYVLFDTEDPQARKAGKELARALSLFPGTTEYVELGSDCEWIDPKKGRDPANLTQDCADEIMATLT